MNVQVWHHQRAGVTSSTCKCKLQFTIETSTGLVRTEYTHCIWPSIWWFPCQKHCLYTVYIWFWPTLGRQRLIDTFLTRWSNRAPASFVDWTYEEAKYAFHLTTYRQTKNLEQVSCGDFSIEMFQTFCTDMTPFPHQMWVSVFQSLHVFCLRQILLGGVWEDWCQRESKIMTWAKANDAVVGPCIPELLFIPSKSDQHVARIPIQRGFWGVGGCLKAQNQYTADAKQEHIPSQRAGGSWYRGCFRALLSTLVPSKMQR